MEQEAVTIAASARGMRRSRRIDVPSGRAVTWRCSSYPGLRVHKPTRVQGSTETRTPATPGPGPPRTPLMRPLLLELPRRLLLLRVHERDRRRHPRVRRAVLGVDLQAVAGLGQRDRDPYVADVLLEARRPHGVRHVSD